MVDKCRYCGETFSHNSNHSEEYCLECAMKLGLKQYKYRHKCKICGDIFESDNRVEEICKKCINIGG